MMTRMGRMARNDRRIAKSNARNVEVVSRLLARTAKESHSRDKPEV